MNILVYDVAAETGGALTVLEQFYSKHMLDKKNHYVYLLSVAKLESNENIDVLNVPWIKRSWLHRLVFDYFYAPKFVKKYQIDEVLSLQNTYIPRTKVYQSVYVHNALPFSEHRFSFAENRFLWIYQNLIGKKIKQSIRRADKVIVQTEWMKRTIEKDILKGSGNIEVEFPVIEGFLQNSYFPGEMCVFFYPANSAEFKNHQIILEAAKSLKNQGVFQYQCVFTLQGNETESIKRVYEEGNKNELPFHWVGQLSKDEMAKWYSKSVLLFPSYIETVGLPIYEAAYIGAPLLLAKCEYTADVIDQYKNVQYFSHIDKEDLASRMKEIILTWKDLRGRAVYEGER